MPLQYRLLGADYSKSSTHVHSGLIFMVTIQTASAFFSKIILLCLCASESQLSVREKKKRGIIMVPRWFKMMFASSKCSRGNCFFSKEVYFLRPWNGLNCFVGTWIQYRLTQHIHHMPVQQYFQLQGRLSEQKWKKCTKAITLVIKKKSHQICNFDSKLRLRCWKFLV